MNEGPSAGRHLPEEVLAELASTDRSTPAAHAHLASCPQCRDRLAKTRDLVQLLDDLPAAAASPSGLRARARDAMRRGPGSLQEREGPMAPPADAPPVLPSPRPRPGRWALRAAAAIALFLGGVATGRIATSPTQDGLPTRPPSARVDVPPRASDPSTASAADVQRAGTAYVTAIADVVVSAGALPPSELAAAREVAYAALVGATHELTALGGGGPVDEVLLRSARNAWLTSPSGEEGE